MRIKDITLVLLAAAMTGTVSAQGIISSINGGNWGAPTTGRHFTLGLDSLGLISSPQSSILTTR